MSRRRLAAALVLLVGCPRPDDAPSPDDAAPDDTGAPLEAGPEVPEPDRPIDCPPAPGLTDAGCWVEPSVECRYNDACAGRTRTCTLRCIGGSWLRNCETCSGLPLDCPSSPPKHGAACTTVAGTAGARCVWNACAADNEYLTAECVDSKFRIEARLCKGACRAPGENMGWCDRGTICVEAKPCGLGVEGFCLPNPCATEPFSCACAGSLCGPLLVCASAQRGIVQCVRPAAPAPGPLLLASDQSGSGSLAVDATYAYWFAFASKAPYGRIRRVSRDGGVPDDIVATDDYADGLELDATHVYLAQRGKVSRAPLSGGTPTLVWTASVPPPPVGALRVQIALDAKNVYIASDGSIYSVAKTGSAATLLVSGEKDPTRLVADGTWVYWTTRLGSTVRKVGVGGGPITTLAPTEVQPMFPIVDATSLFWIDRYSGYSTLRKVDLAGGAPVEVATGFGSGFPMAMDGDATHLFVADFYKGVAKVSKTGDVAWMSGVGWPIDELKVQGPHFFTLTNRSCGAVLRVAK